MTLILTGDAPAFTVVLRDSDVATWRATLGHDDVIAWCTANDVSPDVDVDRIYIHGWDDGRRVLQLASLLGRDYEVVEAGTSLPLRRSLPEGIGHLIRWDAGPRPASPPPSAGRGPRHPGPRRFLRSA